VGGPAGCFSGNMLHCIYIKVPVAFGLAHAESFAKMAAEEVAAWLIANGTGWSIDARHQHILVNTPDIIAGNCSHPCLLA
jgi:hypothetical protein